MTRPGSSSPSPDTGEKPRAREADWLIERIAQRTAALILDELAEQAAPAAWTTTAQVAEHLQVSEDVVYANADRLGATRIGDGKRPMLRFPPLAEVDELLRSTSVCSVGRESEASGSGTAARVAPRRRGRVSGTRAPLLPIRGEDE